MRATGQKISNLERGWPCQRLRLGWALILFYFFETLIGQQLPLALPVMMLGLGIACLVSAMFAIREWKMEAQLAILQDAIDRMPNR